MSGASGKTARLRIAGLDLGTNTCLCLIADVEVANGEFRSLKVVRDEVRIVRLGQGVHASRALHPEALARAEETFREFSGFIKTANCDRVLAVATSAARDVKNGSLLIELGRKYGIPIEIISGEKEAELTFSGAFKPCGAGLTAMIDVGGGSTEIIFGDHNGILLRFSADVGSVRLTERFIKSQPIPQHELMQIKENVRASLVQGFELALDKFNEPAQPKVDSGTVQEPPLTKAELFARVEQTIGVAGTPTTLAAVDLGQDFETEAVHGYEFNISSLDEWTARLASMSVAERQSLAGMEPKRADVIVSGAICLAESMRAINSRVLKVSVRGLRYGVVKWCAVR